MAAPAIILVNPQMGENIGAAARAMHNFGLSDLRIIAPRDGWPNESAAAVATSAAHILDGAKIYQTTHDAVADLQVIYATTARDRRMVKRVCTPKEVAREVHENAQCSVRSGILFGAERTGLTNEDITLSSAIISIPTAPENPSLNIAQSLVVVAYEWFAAGLNERSINTPRGTTGPDSNAVSFHPIPASQEDLRGMLAHLESELDAADFWKEPKKKPLMWQNMQNIFTRGNLTEQEVKTLRGVIRALVSGM
jgi:tRNA/rRNA methyltransferase